MNKKFMRNQNMIRKSKNSKSIGQCWWTTEKTKTKNDKCTC